MGLKISDQRQVFLTLNYFWLFPTRQSNRILRSPEIFVADFFLFTHLRHRVYRNYPQNLEQVRNAICEEIETIFPTALKPGVKKF